MMTSSSQETLRAEILKHLPKFIKPVAGFLIIFFLLRKVNIERDRRERQIVMPVIAVVYSILMVVLGTILFQKFNISKVYGIFRIVVNTILARRGQPPLIPEFTGGIIVYCNLFMLALYVVIKLIACRILDALMEKKHELLKTVSDEYYEFDRTYGRWFLKEKWRGFQRLFNTLAWVSVFVGGICLGISWTYEYKTRVAFVIFPFILVLICNEISAALDGKTKAEYENTIDGEDSVVAGRIGNFQKLLDIYERLLKHNLLSSQRGSDFAPKKGVTDYIDQLGKSDDQVEQLAAHYFEQQNKEGVSLDIDAMHGSLELLHRESVIFMNPFYRDMSKYLLLPLVDSLIRGYKCLFLIGEKDISDDIKAWINEMLEDYARVSGIWRIASLGQEEPNCEIGVLDFPGLYDIKVQEANREFFQNVSIVVMVESSNMIPTAQVALGAVVKELNRQDEAPVYCIIDRNADGLIDTFSHVLKTSITNVVATPVPHCIYTAAMWDANGDFLRQKWFKKETRFLGNIIELAAIAIKNQIPEVTLIGGKSVPTRDIEWIAGQYYPQISDYAHMLRQQASIRQCFKFEPNFWNLDKEKERFLIVEDQYCNMYETLRLFLSRGEDQSFVNVMSGSYLLRDYMHYNRQIFMSDPKAVPTIIPDYARTERNITLQLIMRMAVSMVPEHELAEELVLLDIPDNDSGFVRKALEELINRYTLVNASEILATESCASDPDSPVSDTEDFYFIAPEIFEKYFQTTLKNTYYVTEEQKLGTDYVDAKMYGMLTQCILPGQFMVSNGKYYQVEKISPEYGVLLRRASDRYDKRVEYRQLRRYVFEVDKDAYVPVRNRTVMDISFSLERRNFRVVTDGYLEMKSYHDLKTARVVDFSKDPSCDDLGMEGIDFKTEVARKPMERAYRNKNVLRITMPDMDVNMRMTFAMLLQEIFRTIYPTNWQYIAVLSEKDEEVKGMLNYITYDTENFPGIESDIFIVEDSDIDIGLLESIEHNFERFMELITDYLTWHFEQMSESQMVDPVKRREFSDIERSKSGKQSRRRNILGKLRAALGIGKKGEKALPETEEQADGVEEEAKADKPVSTIELGFKVGKNKKRKSENEGTDSGKTGFGGLIQSDAEDMADRADGRKNGTPPNPIVVPEWDVPQDWDKYPEAEEAPMEDELLETEKAEELFAADGTLDDFESINGLLKLPRTRYRRNCFLKFGFDEIDERIAIENLKGYLTARGYGVTGFEETEVKAKNGKPVEQRIDTTDNALMNARNCDIDTFEWLDVDENENEIIYCDFCGTPLSGVSYEELSDGRIRCNDCAATAIENVDEFKRIFEQSMSLMQSYYRIIFDREINVMMADAKYIAKQNGAVFKPTKKVDARVVGFAQRKGKRYSLVIENGSPRLASVETMVHELTHIWQYRNWSEKKLEAAYSRRQYKLIRTTLFEGMAVWAATQYLYIIGETAYANMQEKLMEMRLEQAIVQMIMIYKQTGKFPDITDPYAFGFYLYKKEYPLYRNMEVPSRTPFNRFPPTEDRDLISAVFELVLEYGQEKGLL